METQFKLLRKDLDRIFDGTEHEEGVLQKLDKLSEIAEILRDIKDNGQRN